MEISSLIILENSKGLMEWPKDFSDLCLNAQDASSKLLNVIRERTASVQKEHCCISFSVFSFIEIKRELDTALYQLSNYQK